MSSDVVSRLTSIFETGIFYNTAIDLYYDQIQLVDELEGIVLNCPSEIQERILSLISHYHLEKNPKQENEFLRKINILTSNPRLVSAVNNTKLKLNLTWELSILNKKIRDKLQPETLLDEYFNVYNITDGFKVFDEKNLAPVIIRLSILELLRKKNTFFKYRVDLYRNSETGTIHILYDELRTSFRQSLVFAYDNSAGKDGLDFLKEAISSNNLKNHGGILMALSFNQEKRKHTISKEAYYENFFQKHLRSNNAGFSDKRIIYRGSKKLDDLKIIIKNKYELNVEDKLNQNRVFTNESNAKIDDRVSAYVTLQSALSAYVNFYAFILANLDFFKNLKELKKSIENEFSSHYEPHQLDSYLLSLFNFINHPVEKSNKTKLDADLDYINIKYSSELKILRSYNVQQEYWGYFFTPAIFPDLKEIITIISTIYKVCDGDYTSVSHKQLDSLGITDTLKKTILINRLIPREAKIIYACYGKSDHAIVRPMNNINDIPGNIMAALRLYDKNAKSDFLVSTISIKKINKIEEIIWGLLHHYEKEFSKEKITNKITLDKIDELYNEPILETRFLSGLKASKKIINSFREK
ncbi:hypothetical protein EKN56_20020 [Limnobaculum zhutongyuii]|uniref:Uncharacterized protein n=1 Tax=Limnobaculum zhutongyuii TaxID=2498113 RepID=A0A411WQK5_9GAMM|nr:hypothetical protein [Limnobaculum zhutongyuii]QBH98478.1 hypothetical protein EKN56_20020 [Limnobaculum zhutongyuii]TQS90075.1 hypothetical protein ELQ32_04215 [Limnobaculum zhutongyuii]